MWENIQLPVLGIMLAVNISVGVKLLYVKLLFFIEICRADAFKLSIWPKNGAYKCLLSFKQK